MATTTRAIQGGNQMPLFDVKGITPKTKTKSKKQTGTSLFDVKPKAKEEKEYISPFIQPGQFTPEEEPIASKIQQRRLQLLVHSYIYYRLDINIIEDRQWDIWAAELVELQKQYPEIAEKVIYNEPFIDWDASTGFHLPFDEWVMKKAKQLTERR